MNLTQISSKSKTVFVIAAALLLVLLVFILFSFLNSGSKPKQTSIPEVPIQSNNIAYPSEPPANIKPSIEEKKQKLLEKQIQNNNGDITLEQNSDYNIKYITAPDVFFVTIYSSPPDLYKTQASSWFLAQNLEQMDLCYLNVRFRLASKELAQNNPTFSSLPDGCQ